MFQLEILDALITEDKWNEDLVAYLVRCRSLGGDIPMCSGPVWIYGAGKPAVKSSMSYFHLNVQGMEPELQGEAIYLLYVAPGEAIADGMMISDVPPDKLEGHTGK